MTTPTLKFNRHFSPAKTRSIRLALEKQLVSDKAQARVEGVSPRSIGNRWNGIASDLHLKYGERERANVAIELVRSRAVEFLMLAACAYASLFANNTDQMRPPRPTRAPVVQIIRPGKNRGDFNPLRNTNFDEARKAA